MWFAKHVTRVETVYCVTDRLHNGRAVQVPGNEIAPTVSAWLAEFGVRPWLRTSHKRRASVTGWRPMSSATNYPLM
jgi:hypothetical protein